MYFGVDISANRSGINVTRTKCNGGNAIVTDVSAPFKQTQNQFKNFEPIYNKISPPLI